MEYVYTIKHNPICRSKLVKGFCIMRKERYAAPWFYDIVARFDKWEECKEMALYYLMKGYFFILNGCTLTDVKLSELKEENFL